YLGSQKKISILGGYKNLIKEGGVLSLWRGNGMNVIKIIPETSLRFASYEQFKKLFQKIQNKDTQAATGTIEKFLAGSCAGALSQTVIYPLDVLKVRFSLQRTGEYAGMFDAIKKISSQEGYRAFWRGYLLNIAGIIPYAGFDLACYEATVSLKSDSKHVAPVGQMFRDVWRTEGIVGFYRGLVPNILKVVPAVSISYLVYETVMKEIKK
ncbi:unnamed protein product, partial [Didymodactylos carnosus]